MALDLRNNGGDDRAAVSRRLTPEEQRRQRIRSVAIAWFLVALVILFFLVTLVRLGGNVVNRPI
jgi:hypothetical protein